MNESIERKQKELEKVIAQITVAEGLLFDLSARFAELRWEIQSEKEYVRRRATRKLPTMRPAIEMMID